MPAPASTRAARAPRRRPWPPPPGTSAPPEHRRTTVAAGESAPRLELQDVLAAAELDRAHEVRPAVERHLFADARQPLEHHPAGRDEIAVFVGPVDARDRSV